MISTVLFVIELCFLYYNSVFIINVHVIHRTTKHTPCFICSL